MKYKVYNMNCADGRCADSVVRDEEECPKCKLPVSLCRTRLALARKRKGGGRLDFDASRFKSLLESERHEIERLKRHILDRRDFVKIASGRPVTLPDLDHAAESLMALIYELRLKAGRMGPDEMKAGMRELEAARSPVIQFLNKLDASLSGLADEVWLDPKVARSFSGASKVKTIPAVPEERNQKKMGTMKIFSDGAWKVIPVKGEALAAKAKALQKENPAWDFSECLIQAEKVLLSESDASDPAVKELSEGGGNAGGGEQSDRAVLEFTERTEGLARSDLAKLASAKRGHPVKLSTGDTVMKVFHNGADRFLPVSFRDAEDAAAFQDPKNFSGRDPVRGRFIPPKKAAEKKPGFSEDGKSFTDFRTGRVTPVLTDSNEETEVETLAFVKNFDLQFAPVLPRDRDAVARRALRVLRAGGIQPFEADTRQVSLAVQAGMSAPDNFDAALRYTSSREFLSFEKAVTAALA